MAALMNDVGARLRLAGRSTFSAEAKLAARDIRGIGTAAAEAGAEARVGAAGLGVLRAGVAAVTTAVKVGVVAVAAFTVGVGILSVKAASDYQRSMAQVRNAIKVTAGVAGISANGVDKLTASIEHHGARSRAELTQTAAQFLRFNRIRNERGAGNDIFNRAVRDAADLARGINQPIKNATLQLAKGLQDPVRSLQALRRAGVTFQPEEEKQIKALAQHNHLLEAQSFLLTSIESRYRGAEAAYGRTAVGSLHRLENAMADTGREAVYTFMPSITKAFATATADVVRFSAKAPGYLQAMRKRAWSVSPRLGIDWSHQNSRGIAADITEILGLGHGVEPILSHIITLFFDIRAVITKQIIPTIKGMWATFSELRGPQIVLGFLFVVLDVIHGIARNRAAIPVIAALITLISVSKAAGAIQLGLTAVEMTPALVGLGRMVFQGRMLLGTVSAISEGFGGLFYLIGEGSLSSIGVMGTLELVLGSTAAAVGAVVAVVLAIGAAFVWSYFRFDSFRRFVNAGVRDIGHMFQGLYHRIADPFRDAYRFMKELYQILGQTGKGSGGGLLHKGLTFGKSLLHMVGIRIPGLAGGGHVTHGGTTLVGERGPELLNLPTAARVKPLDYGENRDRVAELALLDRPIVLQAVVNKRVVAEATVDGLRDAAARQ